ncbi:SAM-dependent methyltransferase [Rugosimonospora acidiphila]|uniref:SAM-dependent methyltransferase n=1 Tax=Rugosimonospora acidiphila TaxID=556531 RepID=A0ABP9RVS3_9ACTN
MSPDESKWNDLDTTTPNPARMYDYLLGGGANFAADRAAVDQVLRTNPQGRQQTQANRAFLRRVVHHLAGLGVRQFLDLGAGVPTVGPVHEIAHRYAPEARVVYVDNEPIAATYSRRVLAGVPGTAVVEQDIRDVDTVIARAGQLLDFAEPVAVLAFAVLHFLADDAVAGQLVVDYRERTVAGSWLAISHGTAEDDPAVGEAVRHYQHTSMPGALRTRAQVTAFFKGYDLVEPGVVGVPDWHPDPLEEPGRIRAAFLGGLGRRP